MGYAGKWAIVLAALAATTTSPVIAQVQIVNVIGKDAYNTACAVCHGSTGQGDGEFADVLTVKPADLTTLRNRNGGVFPYMDVYRSVDGREAVRAHGSSAMPIWGNYFESNVGEVPYPFSVDLLVRTRITALVDYIETLQK